MPDSSATRLAPGTYVLEEIVGSTIVVLEDTTGKLVRVPRAWLPADAREGDVLRCDMAPAGDVVPVRLTVDAEATRARRREMEERHDSILRAPEGDLDL